jgi:cation transport ATPase
LQLEKYTMRDIKKELERYTRNNYLRKEIIERLQNDGFDITEINEEMSKQMEEAEDRIVMNMLYFFPSFLYILLLAFLSMYGINTIDSIVGKALSFLALIAIIVLGYKYYRESKVSFLIVAITMYAGLAFLFIACAARIALEYKIPFVNYAVMAFGAVYLYFFAKENLWVYKSIKKEL